MQNLIWVELLLVNLHKVKVRIYDFAAVRNRLIDVIGLILIT